MPKLNGGQALIQQLQREGMRVVFGIPGAGQYEAVDALYGQTDLRYISVHHEQAATYMADGYGRASGEVAAALVVQGPGLFNAASGIATAYAVSSPLLVITGAHHLVHKNVDRKRATTNLAWLPPGYKALPNGLRAPPGRARSRHWCMRPSIS